MQIPDDRLRAILFEALRRDFGNQWLGLTQAVAWVAIEQGIYAAPQDTRIVQIDPADEPRLRDCFRQLVSEGVMTLGIEGGNESWPWVSLTSTGRDLIFGDGRSSGDPGTAISAPTSEN